MNWHDIQNVENLKLRLNKLGYKMDHSKWSSSGQFLIGVYPLEDRNPIYSRDAELYTGTVEAIISWVRGIEHQNEYLLMLKATTEKRIKALEDKYVKTLIQKGVVQKIKDQNIKLDKHTEDLIKINSTKKK